MKISSNSRSLRGNKRTLFLLSTLTAAALVSACGGSGSSAETETLSASSASSSTERAAASGTETVAEIGASIAEQEQDDSRRVATSVSESDTDSTAEASSRVFVHPGILNSQAQINFVKAQLAQEDGVGFRTDELKHAKDSRYARLAYVAQPVPVMVCGQGSGAEETDVGCLDAREDALAAYTLSLVWAYTGDQRYANKAISILNAWSSTLTKIEPARLPYEKYGNGPLQAAWLAELFPRSAEILRHTNSGWAAADSRRFGVLLETVMLPLIRNGWSNAANWTASMASGTMNIGIYTNNAATFDQGLRVWRHVVPSAIYLESDGPHPIKFNPGDPWDQYWSGPTEFRKSGMVIETCKDLGHVQMELASLVQAAETAGIQQVNLYNDDATKAKTRITSAFEFTAYLMNKYPPVPTTDSDGRTPLDNGDNWLCAGRGVKIGKPTKDWHPTWEIGYAHYHDRAHVGMGETKKAIDTIRALPPRRRANNLQSSWETLTHAGVPSSQ